MTSFADLASLTSVDFERQLHTVFALRSTSGDLPLTLSRVAAAGEATREGGAFSLLFVAPKGPWLPQAIYPLLHPALGTLEIFLVPIGPTAAGNGYQAVFG